MTSYSKLLEAKLLRYVRPQCKVGKCEMKLDGFPSQRFIIDLDLAVSSSSPGKRCDYVIVADEVKDTYLLPVEFKSGNLNFTKMRKQLEGGIQHFKKYLRQFRCCPILVSDTLKKQERSQLVKIKIDCGQGRKRVKHVLCNKSLRWDEVKKVS